LPDCFRGAAAEPEEVRSHGGAKLGLRDKTPDPAALSQLGPPEQKDVGRVRMAAGGGAAPGEVGRVVGVAARNARPNLESVDRCGVHPPELAVRRWARGRRDAREHERHDSYPNHAPR